MPFQGSISCLFSCVLECSVITLRRSPEVPARAGLRTALASGKVSALPTRWWSENPASGRGPMATLKHLGLAEKNVEERARWIENARIDSILGGMRSALPSLKSGLRCYVAFVGWIVFLSLVGFFCFVLFVLQIRSRQVEINIFHLD